MFLICEPDHYALSLYQKYKNPFLYFEIKNEIFLICSLII